MRKNYKQIINDIEQFEEVVEKRETEKFIFESDDIVFELSSDNELQLNFAGGQKIFPIRETALASILNRMNIGGKTLYSMLDSELCEVFKVAKKYMPQYVTVMITDGCVNSINSDIYAHIPMKEILEETMMVVGPMYSTDKMKVYIETGYDKTFIKFFTDRKYSFNGRSRKLIITLTNSENGTSAVRYAAYIQTPDGLIPLMSDVTVVHKGESTVGMNRVVESISMLDGIVNNAINALRNLQKIEISKVETAIKSVGKRCGLPQKYIDQVKQAFANKNTCYASEIYEVFATTVTDQENLNTLERYKNDVLKMINITWDEFK